MGDSATGAEVVMPFIARTADGGAGFVGRATVTVPAPGCARWKAVPPPPRDVRLDLTGDCNENRTVCCDGQLDNLDGAINVEEEEEDVVVEAGGFFAWDPLVRASCRMDVLTGEVREGGGNDGGFITAG